MFICPKITRMKRHVKLMKICTTNKTDKRLTSFLEKELQRIEQKNKGYDQKTCNMEPKLLYERKRLVFSFTTTEKFSFT